MEYLGNVAACEKGSKLAKETFLKMTRKETTNSTLVIKIIRLRVYTTL